MQRDDAVLLDILLNARDIVAFTQGFDEERFRADGRTVSAVLYKLTIIGEAVRRLSREFTLEHPEVPWVRMAGLRNVLVHEYDRVRVGEVWRLVQTQVPALIEALGLLERLVPPLEN